MSNYENIYAASRLNSLKAANKAVEQAGAVKELSNEKGSTQEWKASDKVSSLNDLKEKAPEVYDKILFSIANNMINQNNKFIDRLKRINREYHRPA